MTTIEDVKVQLKKEFKTVLWDVYTHYNGPDDVVVNALFAKDGVNVKDLFVEACREWIAEIEEAKKEELEDV